MAKLVFISLLVEEVLVSEQATTHALYTTVLREQGDKQGDEQDILLMQQFPWPCRQIANRLSVQSTSWRALLQDHVLMAIH